MVRHRDYPQAERLLSFSATHLKLITGIPMAITRHARSLISIVSLGMLAACAAPVSEPERAGFLSDYSKLEMQKEGHIGYIGDRMAEYDKFMFDPIEILFERDPENQIFSDDDIEELKAHLLNEVTEQLTKGDDGYAVVTEPGPGVLRVRVGITEVEETIGVLNVTIYTKVTGLGLGGVAAEGEAVDSVTGEQIAAMVRWGSGSRIARAGLTKMGDAKLAIDKWSRDWRKRIDEVHGR